jgi:hypothetical protein
MIACVLYSQPQHSLALGATPSTVQRAPPLQPQATSQEARKTHHVQAVPSLHPALRPKEARRRLGGSEQPIPRATRSEPPAAVPSRTYSGKMQHAINRSKQHAEVNHCDNQLKDLESLPVEQELTRRHPPGGVQ